MDGRRRRLPVPGISTPPPRGQRDFHPTPPASWHRHLLEQPPYQAANKYLNEQQRARSDTPPPRQLPSIPVPVDALKAGPAHRPVVIPPPPGYQAVSGLRQPHRIGRPAFPLEPIQGQNRLPYNRYYAPPLPEVRVGESSDEIPEVSALLLNEEHDIERPARPSILRQTKRRHAVQKKIRDQRRKMRLARELTNQQSTDAYFTPLKLGQNEP